jgi:hypothetical protein
MGAIFNYDLHDEFGTWPLGYTAYGGAEVGEIIAAAEAVGDGVPRGGAASPVSRPECAAGSRGQSRPRANPAGGRQCDRIAKSHVGDRCARTPQ